MEDVAYQNRMRIFLCNADEDPEKEAFYLEMMRDENVSGVILSPTLALQKDLHPSNYPFPLVLVDRCERDVEADAVVLDTSALDADAAFRAALAALREKLA